VSPSVFIVVRRRLDDGSWVSSKAARGGEVRYVVRYRLGGRGARVRHGGSFRTRREAEERARHISGEFAARRVPNLAELQVYSHVAESDLADAARRLGAQGTSPAPSEGAHTHAGSPR